MRGASGHEYHHAARSAGARSLQFGVCSGDLAIDQDGRLMLMLMLMLMLTDAGAQSSQPFGLEPFSLARAQCPRGSRMVSGLLAVQAILIVQAEGWLSGPRTAEVKKT